MSFAAVHTLCLPQVPGTDAALLISGQQVLPIRSEGQAGNLQEAELLSCASNHPVRVVMSTSVSLLQVILCACEIHMASRVTIFDKIMSR